MTKRANVWMVGVGLFLGLTGLPGPAAAEELNDETFRKLHKELQVSNAEPWRTIPWKIALLDAQRTAAAERKPIFIWAMDGHPLGCT